MATVMINDDAIRSQSMYDTDCAYSNVRKNYLVFGGCYTVSLTYGTAYRPYVSHDPFSGAFLSFNPDL